MQALRDHPGQRPGPGGPVDRASCSGDDRGRQGQLPAGEGQLPEDAGRFRQAPRGPQGQGDGGHRGGDLREVLPPGQQQSGAVPGGRGRGGGRAGASGLLPLLRVQQPPGPQVLRDAKACPGPLSGGLPLPPGQGEGHDRHYGSPRPVHAAHALHPHHLPGPGDHQYGGEDGGGVAPHGGDAGAGG